MKVLAKFVVFLAVFCVIDASHAALRTTSSTKTSRVSVAAPAVGSAAMRRIPTMTFAASQTPTTAATTTSAGLMAQTECVDAYTECIKGDDACGADFEECTTNELFYAKKPNCNSVLMQCASAGVSVLFGTSDTSALAAKNANDEYVYPTAGSVLGQYIEAGAISNRLDTGNCVKKYTSCLKKENVCGSDFELCTDEKEFKKQKIYCESTLARCQDEGKKELFGVTDTTGKASAGSRIDIMIKEGADLAAANAVATCYKVADQCIMSACASNPYRCIADTSSTLADVADWVEKGKAGDTSSMEASALITKKEITTYMEKACFDTIGGNKYCHMTVRGSAPSAKLLRDEDERMDVFNDIYPTRKEMLADKLIDLRDKFDAKAKDACRETIASCAMRTCGDGIGSACYSQAFKEGGSDRSINNAKARPSIASGCAAIVNNDVNCQYAAAASGKDIYDYSYTYQYSNSAVFDKLFPSEMDNDPIGIVGMLNASLAENYSDAAIDQLAKQCKNTVISCVRSMCGSDYAKCYRNRSDIMSDTYGTDNNKFNQSMNKVSGILDFTIIRGLCGNVVTSSAACEEHLKIQTVKANKTSGGLKTTLASQTKTVKQNVATSTATR